jgi:hypothetical protein
VITKFNPDHADEKGELAAKFVCGIVGVLGGDSPSYRILSRAGERRVKAVISGRHRKRRRAWTNPSPRLVYWIMPRVWWSPLV